MTTYQYKQLSSSPEAIRLLRVHKETPESSLIECSLHDAFITTTEYIALSYVWGTDLPTYKILVDDKIVFVRPNLWAFLHYVRETLSEENLWIDNLCINQADEEERSIQVALMGRIYTQAAQVRSWLNGPKTVFTAVEGRASGASLLATTITKCASPSFDLCNTSEVLAAMARLVMHEYWSRAWIVQEVLLAKSVILAWEGQEIVWGDLMSVFEHGVVGPSLDHFTFETQLSSYLNTMNSRPFARLAFFGILSYARSGNLKRKQSLIEVMLIFQYQQASDFHDRAFTFLGLADMSEWGSFKTDYKDSADELYCRIVFATGTSPNISQTRELGRLMNVTSHSLEMSRWRAETS